jgi:iron complex outermembrane receptor protein
MKFRHALLAVSTLGTAVLGLPAIAQQPQPAIEEVVVTARQRTETLDRTPLSISAFTARALETRGIRDINDLATVTPGFTFIAPGGVTNASPIIRGQTQAGRTGDEVNVATFIDNVYVSGRTGVDVFFNSLERIEVVRGPQSALYGRNSFAGAINYITKKPSEEFGAGVTATVGEHGQKGGGAYVTGPILADKLLFRLDGAVTDSGGEFKNQVTGDRLNDREIEAVRLQLLFKPTEAISIRASTTYQDDFVSPLRSTTLDVCSARAVGLPISVQPFDECRIRAASAAARPAGRLWTGEVTEGSTGPYFYDARSYSGQTKTWRHALQIDAGLAEGFDLTSITSYETRSFSALTDYDDTPQGRLFPSRAAPPVIAGRYIQGVGPAQTLTGSFQKRQEFSQEVRFTANVIDRLNLIAGGYYNHLDLTDQRRSGGDVPDAIRAQFPFVNTSVAPIAADGRPPLSESTDNVTKFTSIFASAEGAITDAWKVTLEGRYTWEKKSANNTLLVGDPPFGLRRAKFSYFSPRVITSYQVTDDIFVYASAGKGTKSGGFNNDPVSPTYNPESAWTYEIGNKTNFLDGRLQTSVALYTIDWSNQQITGLGVNPRYPINLNAGKTRVNGLELEATAAVTEWLTLNAGYGYTDSQYKKAVIISFDGLSDQAALGIGPGGDVSGNRLQYVPKHSINAGAQVTTPFIGDLLFTARADVTYSSKIYNDAANTSWIGSRTRVNLRVGVEQNGYRVQAFCNNLNNDRTPMVIVPARDLLGRINSAIQEMEGRKCGVTLSAEF